MTGRHPYIAALAVILLALSGIQCGRHNGGHGSDRHSAEAKAGPAPGRSAAEAEPLVLSEEEKQTVRIETARVSLGPIQTHLSALGKVMAHPHRKAIVSYAFSARISEIHIRIGDWVEKGQALVTLQSEEVGNAKSEFYKARADYDLAQVNFERQKRLFDRGVGAKKDSLSAEADLKVAEVNLDTAEKKLHVLGFTEKQVEELTKAHTINPIITLYAPIPGKIIQNNAVLGGMVDESSEILVILDPRMLCIDADIYEKDISKVRIGQEVEVRVPAYPDQVFQGKTQYISDVLNPETRTITIRTQVPNPGLLLKAGMFADMRIALNHSQRALLVPREALLDEKGEKIVFVKSGAGYLMRTVTLGAREDGFFEIREGLSEGDEVVVKGAFQLKSKLYEEMLKKGQVH
jgi:cobalt-zinc-cadmium efflux system membrane fusion protein